MKGQDQATTWKKRVASVVATYYPFDADFIDLRDQCVISDRHLQFLLDLKIPDTPTPAFDYLFNQSSIFHWIQRDDRRAAKMAVRKLKNAKSRLPENHREIATGNSNLASRLLNLGKLSSALAAAQKSLDVLAENSSISGYDAGTYWGVFGKVQTQLLIVESDEQKKYRIYALARSAQHFALQHFKSSCGKRSKESSVALNGLGRLYRCGGNYKRALIIHNLALQRRILIEDELLAETYIEIAKVYQETKEVDHCRTFIRLAARILEVVFERNPDHPSLAELASISSDIAS